MTGEGGVPKRVRRDCAQLNLRMEPVERDRIQAVIPYGTLNSITIQLLLAEEYDPKAGRLVGNFPQAFSHVPRSTRRVYWAARRSRTPARRTRPSDSRRLVVSLNTDGIHSSRNFDSRARGYGKCLARLRG